MNDQKIKKIIRSRLETRLKNLLLSGISLGHVYVAGGFLLRRDPNDIDIFPTKLKQFDKYDKDTEYYTIVSRTANAKTLKLKDGTIIQLCNYFHETLEKLVESFDFAHIKVGAQIELDGDLGLVIKDIYISNDYKIAKISEFTFFTGSDYPLSSLIRILKYYERGEFSGHSYIGEIVRILTAIVERGFINFDDFKDQIDAVDLGLIPEEIDSLGDGNLWVDLYNALEK